MITTIIVSMVTSLLTLFVTIVIQEVSRRANQRDQFNAERVARRLLEYEKFKKRSFKVLSTRLGGFTDYELRKILVRAGAVRFMSPEKGEMWGIVHRNDDDIMEM